MYLRRPFIILLAILRLCSNEPAAGARKLIELEEEEEEGGLRSYIEHHQEPFGAVCVAYVDQESPNHKLMRKLASVSQESDSALYDLQLQMAAALHWREGMRNETLVIMYRKPFASLWEYKYMSVMDGEDAVFPSKPGQVWKKSEVRSWMLANAFPLINIRIGGKHGGSFPQQRYLGAANPGGAVLVAANLTGDNEFRIQFQLSVVLRPYAELYRGRLRFTFLERTKATRELRKRLGFGLDVSLEAELLLIDKVSDLMVENADDLNHFHGNPRKYLLRNLTDEVVKQFFDGYAQGKLPSHWASQEMWSFSSESTTPKSASQRLIGTTFEALVFQSSPQKGRLVAFFNDDAEDGCENCPRGHQVWEEFAEKVLLTKTLREKVDIMMIDQSQNEHPETRVPGKVAEPMVMWYPRGTAVQRRKKRRRLDQMTKNFHVDGLWQSLEDLLIDEDENEEL
mmetsp:Transcript_16742/g.36729  ORF Transcript_16742/g.36729 Transcript_16742/m.36729 type:complete len:454 (-) Transcript_16742:29-1390(-)